jgi:hypothetical protein
MAGNTTSYETAEFYCFWLWEYQRRNEKYVKGNAFAEDYNRKTGNIKSPKKGLTSEYILKRALKNKDIIEGKKDFHDYYYSNISSSLDDTGFVLTKEPDSNNKITAEIDISQPLESVLQGVGYYHKYYQVSSPRGEVIDEGRRQGDSEKRVDGSSNLLNFLYRNKKPKNFKVNVNVLPRAIGLWMWDYIKAKKLTDYKEGCVEATKAFEKFILKRNGHTDEEIKDFLEDKEPSKETGFTNIETALRETGLTGNDITFKKYYDNAEDCIREMKILPIK